MIAGKVIKSISFDQNEILDNITKLYCPQGFECDITYGNGSFWKNKNNPSYCFDIEPLFAGVIKACSTNLPLQNCQLDNCIFDPPFLTYVKNGRNHKSGKVSLSKRFGGYYRYEELIDHYQCTISEVYRVLKPGGKFIFKCQDIIHNHKMHCTHFRVLMMAESEGFRLVDLFILLAKNRMPSPQKGTQRHSRIFHSYFLVLEKSKNLCKSHAVRNDFLKEVAK